MTAAIEAMPSSATKEIALIEWNTPRPSTACTRLSSRGGALGLSDEQIDGSRQPLIRRLADLDSLAVPKRGESLWRKPEVCDAISDFIT